MLSAMSAAERLAYNNALWGVEPTWDGCLNQGYEAMIPNPSDVANSPEFAPLFELLGDMYGSLYDEVAEPDSPIEGVKFQGFEALNGL
jgi:hypothetical protein